MPLRSFFVPSLTLSCLAIAGLAGCGSDCEDPMTAALETVATGRAAALMSVQGLSASDVWIVGADDGSGPSVLHYDGAAWESVDTGSTGDLWWVHPTSDRVTMVGAGGGILELDRASDSVTPHPGPDAGITFFGVWGDSADDVWAVGGDISGVLGPALWHRDAAGWSAVDLSSFGFLPTDLLYKVHGSGAADVYVVGTGGIILRWDGSSWAAMDSGTENTLFTVYTGGSVPVAVGGDNAAQILHLEGGAWVDRSIEFQPQLNGVGARGETMVATGARGSVHRWDGDAWVTDDPAVAVTADTLHGVWVDDEGGFWTVGGALTTTPLVSGVVAYAGCRDVPQI